MGVDIYEPRLFSTFGGGIISEALVQAIDSTLRIESPGREKRIAAIYRGGRGPRGLMEADRESFDQFLPTLGTKRLFRTANGRRGSGRRAPPP